MTRFINDCRFTIEAISGLIWRQRSLNIKERSGKLLEIVLEILNLSRNSEVQIEFLS